MSSLIQKSLNEYDFVIVDPSIDFKSHFGFLDKGEILNFAIESLALLAINIFESGSMNDPLLKKIQFAYIKNKEEFYSTSIDSNTSLLQLFVSAQHREATLTWLGDGYSVEYANFQEIIQNLKLPKHIIGFTIDQIPSDWACFGGQDYINEPRHFLFDHFIYHCSN